MQFPAKTSKCFTSHPPLTSLPQAPYRYTPLYISAPVRNTASIGTRVPPIRSPTQDWISYLSQMIHELFPDSRLGGPTRTPPRQPARPIPPARHGPLTSQPVPRWFPPHGRTANREDHPLTQDPLCPPPSPDSDPGPVPYPRTKGAAPDSRSPLFPRPSDDDLRTVPRFKYKMTT